MLGWYDRDRRGRDGGHRRASRCRASGREAFAALRERRAVLDRDPARLVAAATAGRPEPRRGRLERRRADVRRHRDDRGHDRQRAPAPARRPRTSARLVEADRALLPNAIEESLRLEPAAAVIDRYATRDVELGGAPIARGDLVRLSIAGGEPRPGRLPRPRPLRRPARQRAPPASRSRTGRTSAWACTWPAWRRTRRWAGCSTGCPACGSIPSTAAAPRGPRVPQAARAERRVELGCRP